MVSMVLICLDPNRRCHDHDDPTACDYHSAGRHLLLFVG